MILHTLRSLLESFLFAFTPGWSQAKMICGTSYGGIDLYRTFFLCTSCSYLAIYNDHAGGSVDRYVGGQ